MHYQGTNLPITLFLATQVEHVLPPSAPKMPQVGAKMPQDRTKMPQGQPKMEPRGSKLEPKCSKLEPRCPNIEPRCLQEGAEKLQVGATKAINQPNDPTTQQPDRKNEETKSRQAERLPDPEAWRNARSDLITTPRGAART